MSELIYKFIKDKKFKPLRFLIGSWFILFISVLGSFFIQFSLISSKNGEILNFLPETGTYETCNQVAIAKQRGELTSEQEKYLDTCANVLEFDKTVDSAILQTFVAVLTGVFVIFVSTVFLLQLKLVHFPAALAPILETKISETTISNASMSLALFLLMIAVFFVVDNFWI